MLILTNAQKKIRTKPLVQQLVCKLARRKRMISIILHSPRLNKDVKMNRKNTPQNRLLHPENLVEALNMLHLPSSISLSAVRIVSRTSRAVLVMM